MSVYRSSVMLSSYLPRIILCLCGFSLLTLYSSNAGFFPYAIKQVVWIVVGITVMWSFSYIPTHVLYVSAYPFYILTFLLLIFVSFFGHIGMGAKRWIDLYFFKIQPSELLRLSIILALARFCSDNKSEINSLRCMIYIGIMILLPAILIIKQPDLGSGLLILGVSTFLVFYAGIYLWKFAAGGGVCLIGLPILWQFLHEYQKKRILVFLNPGAEPKTSGYHVIQSKIAIGSGGWFGMGYMQGPQSHLNFLPEKHTDFIFTMFFEEWGLIAGLVLLFLQGMVIGYGFHIGMNTKNTFEQLVCFGISSSIFLYVFVNISMVTGLLPVVGIPLPFVSYGGASTLTLFLTQGIILSMLRQQRTKSSAFSTLYQQRNPRY